MQSRRGSTPLLPSTSRMRSTRSRLRELARRDVDVDRRQRLHRDRGERAGGEVEHLATDRDDEARRLGRGEELVRGEQAARRGAASGRAPRRRAAGRW